MKRLILIAAVLLAACNSEPPSTETTDTRMPIEVQYVRDSALKIHTKAADDASVVTTYQHGESVSILSRRGAWAGSRPPATTVPLLCVTKCLMTSPSASTSPAAPAAASPG